MESTKKRPLKRAPNTALRLTHVRECKLAVPPFRLFREPQFVDKRFCGHLGFSKSRCTLGFTVRLLRDTWQGHYVQLSDVGPNRKMICQFGAQNTIRANILYRDEFSKQCFVHVTHYMTRTRFPIYFFRSCHFLLQDLLWPT